MGSNPIRVNMKPSASLKIKLIGTRGHRCERCQRTKWFDVPIPLEIHHIDGPSNKESNLQLLCCNCHALTSNYRGRGIVTRKEKIKDEVIIEAYHATKRMSELLMRLGLVPKGGNYKSMEKRLKTLGLEVKGKEGRTSIRICPGCNREFVGRKFCSANCSNNYYGKLNKFTKANVRPPVKDLKKMIDSLGFEATGRILGVSGNAIRKWLKS